MRYVRKIAKIFSLTIATLLVLSVIVVLLLSRGVFNERLSGVISGQGTKVLDARLEVQSIRGNPLSSFSMHGIRVFHRDTTALLLDSLIIDYRIGALIRKEVHVKHLKLNRLHLYGVQRSDSSWSFTEVLPDRDAEPSKPDTTKPSAPWKIRLDRLSLEDVSASLSPLDTSAIPSSLRLEGKLGFIMGRDSINPDFMEVALENLALQTHSPALVLRQMQGRFRKTGNRISWQGVKLDFSKTHISSSGEASLPGDHSGSEEVGVTALLKIDPLQLQEFHPWMGEDRIHGSPRITLELKHEDNRQSMDMLLEEGDQSLSLSGWIRNLMNEPSYEMTLLARSLDGYHWTRDTSFRASLTGQVQVKGQGFDMMDNEMDLSGDLAKAGYREYQVDDLNFQAGKARDTLKGTLQGNAWFGGIRSDFQLYRIFDQPMYALHLALRHLDVSQLAGDTALSSDLNLAIDAEGEGMHPDSLRASMELDLRDSRFMDQPLKDMHTLLDYNRQAYHIRGLQLNSPYFSLGLEGAGHINGRNRLSFDFTAGDVQSFMRKMGLPELSLAGGISGKASGTLDSMNITGSLDLNNLYYDTLYVKRLEGNASALLSRDSLMAGDLLLSVDSSNAANQWIEKISLQSSLEKENIQNRLEVRVNDSLSLNTRTDLVLEKNPLILLRRFRLQMDTASWQGGSDSTRIVLGRDSVEIDHLVLRSGIQQVGVNGIYRFRGKESLHVWIERLDVGQWTAMTRFPYRARGILNARVSLEGTAAQPTVEGSLDVEHPGLDTVRLKHLHAGVRYDASMFSLEGYVDAGVNRMIRTRVRLPLEFSLTDSLVMPGDETPIQASLVVDSLDAGLVNPFLESRGMEVRGLIDASLDVAHTLGDPEFTGQMSLAGGTLSYPAEGVGYKNITIRSRFDNRRFQLERMHLESGGGFLNMKGFADLPFLDPEAKDSLYLQIKGEDFQVMGPDHTTSIRNAGTGRLRAVVEPALTLQGTFTKPVLKGDLNIPEATVNVDAFQQSMAVASDDPNPPLLIEAMSDTLAVSPKAGDTTQKSRSFPVSDFYRNLKGTFNIHIPGNTWVRGENMNFEVQGSLKAIKEHELMDLFGTLNVNRGFVQFYGKKFDFEQGEIIFTGGRQINPRVHFIMAYLFRDMERERQRLTIEVTGLVRQPNLQFRLNEQVIQEKEALSYLMFGKSTNQLTTAEQTSLEERTGQMAASFALDRISSAVTKALGAGLGLDMVGLEAGKNWRSGNVKIGKYITDDLYLSYQRTFALDKKEKAIDAERITLEYRIMRSLFLQAVNQMSNSGFDLIFKKSWK